MKKLFLTVIVLVILVGGVWVVKTLILDVKRDLATRETTVPTQTAATPSPTPTPVIVIKELPITLPMLDALFFVDLKLVPELKSKLQLTDEQIAQLRQVAREETSSLQEDETDAAIVSTTAAGEKAATKISAILGSEKAQQFADFVIERWQKIGNNDADTLALSEEPSPLPTLSPIEVPPNTSASPGPSPSADPTKVALMPSGPFAAPSDTRIVVNAPAHRLDVFENGQLVKSYLVGIGYPEFPLPTGMRKASQIIFNPTWTPPDEPWVESSSKVKVGQKIAAGDKLNPLGVLKIPIGLPSLIHGGKQPAKIGGFASHGCVGMTDKQVQSFAKVLAQIGGAELTDEEIAKRAQNRKETKVVKLKTSVPVELRYETMAVEDGKLHIYRDVYDRDTNVKENLEALLGTYGVTMEDLTEEERTQAMAALELMSRAPSGKTAAATLTEAEKAEQRKLNIARQELTRQTKGRKEVVIEIAALAGKGYPAPVDLETGQPPKPEAAPAKTAKAKAK
ncbi:MAG: L,D-transpeptidase [Acidobacteria bacterium]|nr:L,D-transpeptidase [Acidobacteriota bacterium]